MRRPRRPAVEAPIRMLLAVLPVEEAEAAEADDEAVELPEASSEPELLPVAEAELLGARLLVPVAVAALVEVKNSELMQEDWQAAYACVSAADPSPWSHCMAHSVVALT